MSKTDFEYAYLAHHGILGQKWGVRRYQNSDGSLTEAGRKHYIKKAAKDVAKADKQHGNSSLRAIKINKAFSDNPAIKEFKDNSEAYKNYEAAAKRFKDRNSEVSDEINKKMTQKYGKFLELDPKGQSDYFREGIKIMQKWSEGDEYKALLKDVNESSKKYEREVSAFIDKYRNTVMDKETNDIAVKYNPKTGKMSSKTVSIGDVMSIEMLRDKNGRIY